MRRYKLGAHTKTDLKVHIIWIPKYRKRVLTGQVAIRARDLLRRIALEHELDVISGKIARDPCISFIVYTVHSGFTKGEKPKGTSPDQLAYPFGNPVKKYWQTSVCRRMLSM